VSGETQWQVTTYNSSGYGPASALKSFMVKTNPLPTHLIAPSGTLLVNTTPTYSWETVTTATEYLLQVENTTGMIVNTIYTPKNCLENQCTVTPTVPLTTTGTTQWRVQSRNECGTVWSAATVLTIENPPPVMTCQLYAVHDESVRDSQFFVIDPVTQVSRDNGDLYRYYDIEGLDAEPLTGNLYAASGDDALPPVAQGGSLYQLDTAGILSLWSPLYLENGHSVTDISGLSFNPVTHHLWGWASQQGLFEIKADQLLPNATVAQLQWASKDDYDDLTWDETGEILYLASGDQIVTYQQGAITPFCTLPHSRIEALEMTTTGTLLLALHGKESIYLLETALSKSTGQCVVQSAEIPVMYNDIEGMAWVCQAEL
jgi:hypothetical protein